MRHLILLRGIPASGKSTFIREKKLEQYTLSADEIRLLFQSPLMNEFGGFSISQKNDGKVWKFLFELLEERMKRGEFTIIDATHSKTEAINRYKKLAQKYRYRVTVVDFSDVTLEESLKRNKWRESYKFVPEHAIMNMYERMTTEKVPSWVNVIKPDEFNDYIQYNPLDFSEWEKIHIIGDIHGCYTVLMEYLNGGLKDDEMYIFTGDLLDRGIENKETMDFFLSIKDNKNVIFIEGNHDKWFWYWANDEEENIHNKGFLSDTKKELEEGHTKESLIEYKKDVRQFYRKFRQLAYFTYHGKPILVTHGGLSKLPDNLMLMATEQFINGVGTYDTDIDYAWEKNECNSIEVAGGIGNSSTIYNAIFINAVQVHGHRNIMRLPVQASRNSFNLEGQVEFGGYLRAVTIDKNGFKTYEVKNNVFKEPEKSPHDVNRKDFTVEELVEYMRKHDLIKEKDLGDGIASFNFTKKAFTDRRWDDLNIKARGLFINLNDNTIASRSYEKFFNINEVKETKINYLADNLKFPVYAYEKPNGYLGTVGYNSTTENLIFTSKSEVRGEHAEWLKEIFLDRFTSAEINYMERFLRENNASLVFEVIKHKEDPHIIEYNEDDIILLDIIYRDIHFKKFNYNDVVNFAMNFNLSYKQLKYRFDNWIEFYTWYREIKEKWDIIEEGFVIEDSNGFMTKLKLPYYNFWKQMRGIKDKVARNREYEIKGGSLYTPLHNRVFSWMKQQDREWLRKSSIIEVRNKFYEQNAK